MRQEVEGQFPNKLPGSFCGLWAKFSGELLGHLMCTSTEIGTVKKKKIQKINYCQNHGMVQVQVITYTLIKSGRCLLCHLLLTLLFHLFTISMAFTLCSQMVQVLIIWNLYIFFWLISDQLDNVFGYLAYHHSFLPFFCFPSPQNLSEFPHTRTVSVWSEIHLL